MELATAQMMIGKAFGQSSFSVVIFDAELRIVWANEAAKVPRPGLPAQDWHGRRLGEVLPEMDAGLIEQSLRHVFESGETTLDLEVSSGVRGAYVEERYWTCMQFPVSEPGADDIVVVHVMRDVTERAVKARRRPTRPACTTSGWLAVGDACDALLSSLGPNPADDAALLLART